MPIQPVISNNSPLVGLLGINLLSLLQDLYTEVWIPRKAEKEFLKTPSYFLSSNVLKSFGKTESLCYTEYESVHYCLEKKRSAKNDKRTSHP